MSAGAAAAPMSLVRRYWRDRARWMTIADVFVILAALTLPWSTSLVAIFVACWLVAVAWVMDWRAYARLLKQPDLLFAAGAGRTGRDRHALVGRGMGRAASTPSVPPLKLLVLPGLFYHFERSSRGMWVFVAFLVSCTLLMLMSWLVAIDPGLSLKAPGEPGDGRGIFVKNYIAQSQEFALCAVALAYPIITSAADEQDLAGAGAGRDLARLRRQHGVCDRLADGAWSRCRSCLRCLRCCI